MIRIIIAITLVFGLCLQTSLAEAGGLKTDTTDKITLRSEQSIQLGIEKSMRTFLRSYLPRKLEESDTLVIRVRIAPDGSVKAVAMQPGLAQTTARMIERMVTFEPAAGITTVLLKIQRSHYKLVKVKM